MNLIDACFVCTTTYQIMTSINFVLQHKIQADLYICPTFCDAKEIAARIKLQKIFTHTVLVDTNNIEQYKKYKHKLIVHLGIAKNYLQINKIVPGFLVPETVYKKLYVSSKANIGRLMGLYFLKHKIEVETIYFDDGESSYDNPTFMIPSRADALMRGLLFGERKIKVKTLLLYSPELYRKLNPNSKNIVMQLPLFKQDKRIRSIFNYIFQA